MNIKKPALSSLQNLSAPLAGLVVGLPPIWVAMIAAGAGLLAVYRELAEERGKELLEFIVAHKEEFISEIITTPEFKTAFLNVWEMHIRESSQNKRMGLKNFLLSLGSGKKLPSDLHTKIYSVIQQMTDKEAEVFGIIFRGCNRPQFRELRINSTSITGLEPYEEVELRDIWHSLHAYRLISATDATIGNGMLIQQITPFGELFYDDVMQN